MLRKSKAPGQILGNLDAEAIREVVAALADVLLRLDKRGVIRDVVFNRNDLSRIARGKWLGMLWADTVTGESRPQIQAVLRDAASKRERRWRRLDHPATRGVDVPILYSAIRVGNDGDIIVMGRNWRAAESTPTQSRLLDVLEASPDGLVVTTPHGDVLSANHAFLELAQLATVEQVRGQPLDRWLGRQGIDLRVLVGNLRRHGSVRVFATTLRGEYGASHNVEVAAVSAVDAEEPCFGFSIRSVEQRAFADLKTGLKLPHSAQELTELIGRVPLKELVRETTEVIERVCIEAALKLTADNRATAADLLGLSRQSLYAKLRRYGLGELAPAEKPK